ncbi:MAG: DEAD/DEAH box helicase, partial [Helicobacteraceae bacterium]|nr:DEAD/DEAH box helicase [Candidatus Sulfurimonas ponti]
MSFKTLGLSSQILKAIRENGFTNPTPIQTQVIPLILKGEDIMARAQTGTGKSAGFILPLIQSLSEIKSKETQKKAKIRILVLTPTRELTLQIAQGFDTFSKTAPKSIKTVSLIGGEKIGEQLYDIQQGCDILVATSGRFIDVLSKKQMSLENLEFLVLDEADKMLDLGFAEELDSILSAIPDTRQNLLFSATYPEKMLAIASRITKEPIQVSLDGEEATVPNILQRVIQVNIENRSPLLRHLIKEEKLGQVLVFMANKRATDNIAMKFKKHGLNAQSFHGDLDQEERNLTLQEFKDKKINILFTTDLISRGLHIDDIDCVVNFDLPRSPTDYIHRIGRTARAGKSGLAISFIDQESEAHFKLIEKRADIQLPRESVQGFELTGEAPKKVKGPAPVKGKKKSKKDKLRELNN